MTYNEFAKKLKEINKMGYIKTHRAGHIGIGKTLEDLLGIKENNVPTPNCARSELKSARKNAKSMLTLFTKSPLPAKANSVLLEKFGYESTRKNGRNELHTMVNAIDFNQLKGKPGFKIEIKNEMVNLVSFGDEILGYWDKDTLQKSFERKIPRLTYVKADSRGIGLDEEFWYNEAWLLSGFDFDKFVKLLKEGIIKVDIRIGQYPDGKPHDHGTGFRIFPNELDLCFSNRKRII
ncbi:MAG: MvaI/BcnI family restriction endonuclease [Elusimicrobiota bacterium]